MEGRQIHGSPGLLVSLPSFHCLQLTLSSLILISLHFYPESRQRDAGNRTISRTRLCLMARNGNFLDSAQLLWVNRWNHLLYRYWYWLLTPFHLVVQLSPLSEAMDLPKRPANGAMRCLFFLDRSWRFDFVSLSATNLKLTRYEISLFFPRDGMIPYLISFSSFYVS